RRREYPMRVNALFNAGAGGGYQGLAEGGVSRQQRQQLAVKRVAVARAQVIKLAEELAWFQMGIQQRQRDVAPKPELPEFVLGIALIRVKRVFIRCKLVGGQAQQVVAGGAANAVV